MSGFDAVTVGRRVLATESKALDQMADQLGQAFIAAVEAIFTTKGRVVLTGVGKSGHVGRKIAATLASTGTPALFVHPAEASHGDLGMIVPGDALLTLSNSGETAELADLIAHSRRHGMPLVAITTRGDSSLAKDADVALLLPAAAEACPNGLAPTTSTTMQIALGDALAVALLTRRGFTAADFSRIHPGGRIGAKLRRTNENILT
jgi:arabinose-5-phosphate isomerase